MRDVELREQPRHPLAPVGDGKMRDSECHIARDIEMREQGIVLEHQPDPALFGRDGAAGCGQAGSRNVDRPDIDRLQTGDHPQQAALAAARRAEQAGNAPFAQFKVGLLDSRHRSIAAGDARQAQDRRAIRAHALAPGAALPIRAVSQMTAGSERETITSAGVPACPSRSSVA